MTFDELQEWCNNHPDYPAYKKQCEEHREKLRELYGSCLECGRNLSNEDGFCVECDYKKNGLGF